MMTIYEPDCREDRHDERGDCDGRNRTYEILIHGLFGRSRGATVTLCGSHARMAGAHREIRRTTPA